MSKGIICPYCRRAATETIETRQTFDSTIIRRRRMCTHCGKKITTRERYRDMGYNRIYISGAITGTDDFIERFYTAEKYLQAQGFDIVNPVYNMQVAPDATHEEYMHLCYAEIDICDAVCFLDGWRESRGARLEYKYAKSKGKTILHYQNIRK